MRYIKSLSAFIILSGTSFAASEKPVTFDWLDYDNSGDPTIVKQLSPEEYPNPLFAGYYPDPSICQVGGDYYLINSTFAYFPGIPIFHSKDLVNWRQLGHVIHRPEQLDYDKLGVSRGIFAPAISHHDGTFYVVCTMVDGGGNFVVTAKDPAGPWSDPIWLGFEGIDPSLFFDDDGRAWMVNNGAPAETPRYDGHRAIWIQEYSVQERKMVGPRKVLVNGGVDISKKPVWIEGPHLIRKDGWYYLCCAEGGTSVNHSQVIHRSREITGPYSPWDHNPILTQRGLSGLVPGAVTSTGHADLVLGPDKNWWAVFLAVRPYLDGRYSPMGRETFLLPVAWPEGGWPTILEPGVRVPLTGRTPKGAVSNFATPERFDGRSGWKEDFDGSVLDDKWFMLRAPKETWWSLSSGRLSVTPRKELLSGNGNPSFLARRVQNSTFSAATAFSLPESGVSSGLALFQGEKHHYFLAAKRAKDGFIVYLEKLNGGPAVEVAQVKVSAKSQIRVRVTASKDKVSFYCAADEDAWQTVAEGEDAKVLTSDVAGGFVGATLGLHARVDP